MISYNYVCVVESKNQIDNNEFQKKVDRLRFKLAVKEEESCKCLAYNRASNVLNNINRLEDNMTKMKLLLTLIEENIVVSPKKYGNLFSFSVLRAYTSRLSFNFTSLLETKSL